ncbi:MAG: DNA internalization-related competence protein ComEC/Rec2, partial [Balneolaceae bacterium]
TTSGGRRIMDLRVSRSSFRGNSWRQQYTIRLYVNAGEYEDVSVAAGDYMAVSVRIAKLEKPSNPGRFNYREYLKQHHIFVHGEITGIRELQKAAERPWLFSLRKIVHNRIEKLFDDSTAPLARALLTGDRREIEHHDQRIFARAGLSHIMAVSGLHVGFIVAPFWLLIPWLWKWRCGWWVGLTALFILLLAYAAVAGFSPSVSRASLMAWLLSMGMLKMWMRESANLMGGSALLLLLVDPSQLFDIGFQLSYGAVSVILLVLPVVKETIPAAIRFRTGGRILMIMLISVIVQIGIFPLLVWYFEEFSVIGPLANAVVVPVMSAVVPFSFLLIIFAGLPAGLVSILNVPNMVALKIIERIAGFMGSLEYGWITVQIESGWIFLLWLSLAGFFAFLKIPSMRHTLVAVILLLLSAKTVHLMADRVKPSRAEITVLDVGQGDAVHISTPEGGQILIDAGRWTPFGNSGDRVLLPYLKSKGIDRLDAVIITHPHADHIGGLPALLQDLDIGIIYHGGYGHDSVLFQTCRSLAAEKNVEIKTVNRGDIISVDPSIRLFVLGPRPKLESNNPNEQSVVLKLAYNRTHFLFAGDAEVNQERRITGTYGDFLKSDLLKAGHHGSRTSSNAHFLSLVRPDMAVVSLSFKNRFGHPHSEAVDRIRVFTKEIYYTSLEGGIVLESDGQQIISRE